MNNGPVVKIILNFCLSFISCIFKKKLVTQGILISCLERLLEQKNSNKIEEEYLEVVIQMLTQTGSLLDLNQDHESRISKCFFILEKVVESPPKDSNRKSIYSTRIRFLARDVIDLKNVSKKTM